MEDSVITTYLFNFRLILCLIGVISIIKLFSVELVLTDSMAPYINAKSALLSVTPFAIKLFCYLINKPFEAYLMNLISEKNSVITYVLERDNRYNLPQNTRITHQAIDHIIFPNIILTFDRRNYLLYKKYSTSSSKLNREFAKHFAITYAEKVKLENVTSIYLLSLTENRMLYFAMDFLRYNQNTIITAIGIIFCLMFFDDILNIINNREEN